MQVLLTFLGSFVSKFFVDKVIGWIAVKTLLCFLFITIVPLILNNFLYDLLEILFNFASGQSAGASNIDGNMSFTGFCAWLLECFRISEAISLLVSALSLRAILSMIPFVRMV